MNYSVDWDGPGEREHDAGERVEKTKRMLRMQPGYVGTCDAATALIDDMATALREISKHYGNQDMNHVDYRVMAKTLADEALSNSEAK